MGPRVQSPGDRRGRWRGRRIAAVGDACAWKFDRGRLASRRLGSAIQREHLVHVSLRASEFVRDARDADVVGTHREDSHAPARMIAGDRNQQAIATKHARHRQRRRQPNRARDQVAGCGGHRDIQAAAAKIRDQLVGGVVTDRITDLIVERGPRGRPRKD